METNSILTMVVSVVEGSVCSVLPGSLVATLRNERELEALPLVGPDVATPICFMSHATARASRALEAALALAQDDDWLRHAASSQRTARRAAGAVSWRWLAPFGTPTLEMRQRII